MVGALTRKLLREMWQMRSQAVAIAVVIAGGVTMLITSLSTLDSLQLTRDAFYRDYRFADVFVSLKRAPDELSRDLAAIDGVQWVETRVVARANIEVSGFDDPVTGLLISLPDGRNADLNALYLRAGRLPDAQRANEVAVSEAFASAHDLRPGDRINAIINGRLQPLSVVGIALSPEHVYQIKPGDLFPDFRRYGVFWMNRSALAGAYDMDGAFNDAVLALGRDASPARVIEEVDLLLAAYGGLGAIPREDQFSNHYLETEMEQLAAMATLFPMIFLGVAAFLLNVVLSRVIATEREQIAVLKAFGYSNLQIGAHYAQLVLAMVALGLVLGTVFGIWLGYELALLYAEFFRFPYLEYRVRTNVFAIAILVTVGAALLGTLSSVRRAVKLPPAEAMRPEAPPTFRPLLLERLGLHTLLAQPTRMIFRNLERRPGKAALSVTGIAFSCAILFVGNFQEGAINHMLAVQFGLAERHDVAVGFTNPTSRRALHELQAMEGVRHVEPYRMVPVELRNGHRSFRTVIQGVHADGDLRRILDTRLEVVDPPPEGLMLTDYLAELLGVGPGDRLVVETLEGHRDLVDVTVTGTVREYIGVSAYMELDALNRLLREGGALSGAWLALEPGARDAVLAGLRGSPRVASITERLAAVDSFRDTMGNTVLVFAFISTLLAGSIAFGVVYNSARIALAERGRELASLRVLGFTRGEISYILLGELAVLVLLAIPLGFLIGIGMCWILIDGMASDFYRVPLIIEPQTYAIAGVSIVLAALLSGLVVQRRLHHLDLVAVLKTRE